MAVEVHQPKGFGRCRIAILPDASAASLHPFITGHVEPAATLITDGWQDHSGIECLGYCRDRRSQRAARRRGEDTSGLLAGVHRVASLARRWLLGTHQGSVNEAHLQAYLDEFVFRSTAAPPAAAGSCSTAFSSSPSLTSRCATGTSSSSRGRSGGLRPATLVGATHRRSSGSQRTSPGEPPDLDYAA